MKILFVNPSLRPAAPHRYIPVGLGYIVTCVRDAGFSFDLLDIDIARYDDAYVENYMRTHKYDVVAVGSIVTHYKWVKWFINLTKSYNPGCKFIVGNSVGGSIPEVIFNYTKADIVIKGEADVTIVEVLEHLRDGKPLGSIIEPPTPLSHANGDLPPAYKATGVEGIIFRADNGQILNTGARKAVKDINTLPYPDWDLFDVQEYIKCSHYLARHTTRFTKEEAVVFPVNTARGCVFKCTFCHYVYWNDPYRHRSAASVIGEIRRNQQKYGANYIEFWDELSFHKIGPTEKFLDELIKADLNIHFNCAVRSDLFGRDDIDRADRLRVATKFKHAGAIALGFSLESGDDGILEAMNKRVKSSYFDEQVKLLREVGLVADTSLVIGYPQETPETIRKTMDMCRRNRIYPSVGFLLPLPATGMWDHALEHGFITDIDRYLVEMTERQDLVLNMTSMTNDEMLGLVKQSLKDLNQEFGNALADENLIKTGGYAKHNEHLDKEMLVMRNRLSNESLNMAVVTGAV